MHNPAIERVLKCIENKNQYLNLENCGLTDDDFAKGGHLEKYLSKCQQIEILDISRNGITIIPQLGNLSQLRLLDLSHNSISQTIGLENLAQLRHLNIDYNQIKQISNLENLSRLVRLSLSHNQIDSVNGLENLSQLKRLVISHNMLTSIKGLENLTALNKLDLRNNNISELVALKPFLEGKNALDIVYRKNYLIRYNEINVGGNPLSSPPAEIIMQGNEVVINYFAALEKQGADYLYEAKMLIVGQPRSGKTSLRYKLFDSNAMLPEEDKSTRGIDIQRLDFDIKDNENRKRKFYYNVWDFGGQHMYQTTHQFFLTQRSLYILVMDSGKDSIGNDDANVNYWMQAVELLGGSSPLLLVKNEKNDRKVNIDLSQRRARFKFLRNDYNIDLNSLIVGSPSFKEKKLKDFMYLKDDIENELKHLPLVGFLMPKKWVQIRNELHELSINTPFITKRDFISLCEKNGLIGYEAQMELSRVFQDLGIFLHFQDYGLLDDFIILQNTWATDAVFAVFDNENVQNGNGKFSDADLAQIWNAKDYEPATHKSLLSLMMQFELCYLVDRSNPNIYIVPEMLADSAPDGYQWMATYDLPILYRYDFMPKGILTRLIVRLHSHIASHDNIQIVWKTGVKIDGTSLDCRNTFAEIIEAWDNKQLNIRVQGTFAKELMSKITYEVDSLNREYFKQVENSSQPQVSRWYKMIPCICDVCKDANDKHFYDYQKLLEMKEFGVPSIRCEKKPYDNVGILNLIDGVFSKEGVKGNFKMDDMIDDVKIFVSYSNNDRDLRELIVSGLKTHLKNRKIRYELWADKEIDLGSNWKSEIEDALKRSNVAILLVSADFAASKFINENELTTFFKRKKEDGYLIMPILLRNYNFLQFEQLSSLNFFKTYHSEYGFNKPTIRHKLIPFDVLGDNENTTDKLLQDYYSRLADYIDNAVINAFNKIL